MMDLTFIFMQPFVDNTDYYFYVNIARTIITFLMIITVWNVIITGIHYCRDNTPGTRVGPGCRGLMLTVRSRKNTRKSAFVKKLKFAKFVK